MRTPTDGEEAPVARLTDPKAERLGALRRHRVVDPPQ